MQVQNHHSHQHRKADHQHDASEVGSCVHTNKFSWIQSETIMKRFKHIPEATKDVPIMDRDSDVDGIVSDS
jgi:hypothetical protein